jgi:hypothetical protein
MSATPRKTRTLNLRVELPEEIAEQFLVRVKAEDREPRAVVAELIVAYASGKIRRGSPKRKGLSNETLEKVGLVAGAGMAAGLLGLALGAKPETAARLGAAAARTAAGALRGETTPPPAKPPRDVIDVEATVIDPGPENK